MIKLIQKWGNSLVIVFTKKEVGIYGLKIGDEIVLDDKTLSTKEKEK